MDRVKQPTGPWVVGKSIARLDGTAKVCGTAQYTADLILPRMLYGKILRSPLPHARICKIDTTQAQRLPGVKGVITGEQIPAVAYGVTPSSEDQYALAREKVRFVGEAVAAVAAVDEATALQALDLIRVDYEVLPAVFDPEEAMQPGAPLLHANCTRNISVHVCQSYGNVAQALAQADYVREDCFKTQGVMHVPLEPHAALAVFDPAGQLTFWACKQSPFLARRLLAKCLQLPESHVQVITPCIGGGFGGKMELFSLDFCTALLARQTGCPVKIVYSREEVALDTRQRHPMHIYLRTGVRYDGRILGRECRLIASGGAYSSTGPVLLSLCSIYLSLPLMIPHARYEGFHVYTNMPVRGPQRGHGGPQLCYATELQLDRIAQYLGMDPLTLRYKNAVQPGQQLPNKIQITSCGLQECLHKATAAIGWKAKRGRLPYGQGVGLACSGFISGVNTMPHIGTTVLLKMNTSGPITVITGATELGQGAHTAIAQIVAQELGVPLKQIKIVAGDTQVAPFDQGSFSSRVTYMTGNAARLAALDAKRQLLAVAATRLKVAPEDLVMEDGRIFIRQDPTQGRSLREVLWTCQFAGKPLPLIGRGFYQAKVPPITLGQRAGNFSGAYSFSAQTAQVEVDLETGEVRVVKVVSAHDLGRAINPQQARGQLEGSVVGGLGQCFWEELLWDQGRLLNSNLGSYRIPNIKQIPEIEVILVESHDPQGPFGAKEAGEGTQNATVAAIVSAIYDAIGVWIHSLPVTPAKILKALQAKSTGNPLQRIDTPAPHSARPSS